MVKDNLVTKGTVPDKEDKGYSYDEILSMDKIMLLPLFSNTSKYFGEQRNNCLNIAPVHIFIDMVFDVVKSNSRVREAGFFKNFPISEETYSSLSKFYRIQNKGFEQSTHFNDEIADHIIGRDSNQKTIKEAYIYKSIDDRVELIFSFFNTLQTLQKKIEKRDDVLGITKDLVTAMEKELKGYSVGNYQEKFRKEIESLQRAILNVDIPLTKSQLPNLSEAQSQLMLDLKVFTDNVSKDYINDVKNLESSRLYLDNKLIPKLTVLNSATYASFKPVISSLDSISKYIRLRGIKGVLTRITDSKIKSDTVKIKSDTINTYENYKNFFYHFKLYIEIVNIINNLDRIESYDKTFNFLMNTASTFGNQKTQQVVSLITSSYDKYTVLNASENKLTLDVESMAVDLFNRYGDNNSGIVSMYFSVGINYAYNFKKSEYIVNDVSMPSKFSFVSEKIGVMVKLFDNNRRYSFGKTRYKPILNNIHSLAYLSGLLYQIDFLNSNDEFKTPLYGAGFGVTSFNGLDLNLTYAVPFEGPVTNGLWTVGLDIKITEYLGALKKKKSNVTN